MKTFKEFLAEEVSKKELKGVEKYADKIFAALGIDVDFTKHFTDRVNDTRNKKPINASELIRLFKQTYKKHGKTIASLGNKAQAVINDMMTDINTPFVLKWNQGDGMLHLVMKTIMRKKNFKTPNKKYVV